MVKIGDVCPLFFNPIKDKFGIEVDYIQKFYTSDKIHLQIFSNADESVSATLVDLINGASSSIALSKYNQNIEIVMHYAVLTGLPDGEYKIGVNGIFSEPFCVSSSSELLERTTLIKYSHKDNNSVFNNVFWLNGAQLLFDWRVEAGFKLNGYSPKLDNEQYRNQWQEIKNLYSVPYDSYVLTIGDACGVPYWYGRHLNRILCLSTFIVKDTGFVRSENSVPEMSQVIEDSQLFNVTCSIEPQYNDISGSWNPNVEETYLISVSINPDDANKCTITASGDVINIVAASDKKSYLITVRKNGIVIVNVVAEEGYQVNELTVDGVSKGDMSEYTFEDINEDHTMSVSMEEATAVNFLVRNDLPDVYYSSTQAALDAIKADYPNGLTQNITLTCIKQVTEKRVGGTWISTLSDWNKRSICYLTIDGNDKLTYDGKSLGGLQFKEVDNVLLRNISFVNCANYAGEYSPSELYALYYKGNAELYARNLMIYQCSFNGLYPNDSTKKAYRTIGSQYSENLTVLGCDISNDYGNCMKFTNSSYVSLLKNTINVDYSLNVVAHPSIMTLKNCYCLNVEDNDLSGDNRENYFELSNVERIYFRRNEFSGGGGRAITMTTLAGVKEVVIDSNLFVGMVNSPAGDWMKEYINLTKINSLKIRNNTFYMDGRFYEQYVTRGGTVENAELFNNILINATGSTTSSINGFVINRCKTLKTGNNLYESMRGLIVSPNADAESEYITIDWTTGRDIAKLQTAGYETNSIEVEDGTKLLEIQNGGDSYKLIAGLEYYSNMAYMPFADIEYKSKGSLGNTRGCYNLAGIQIDENQDITGYTGENYSVDQAFDSDVQYSAMADDILCLTHNTLDRMKLIVFSIVGSQHTEFQLGKSGIIHTYPVLDENNQYEADELYTINVE